MLAINLNCAILEYMKIITNRIFLIFPVLIFLFSACTSTKNYETEEEPQDKYEIGKYAGVPPQYRAILQEQEEKNTGTEET